MSAIKSEQANNKMFNRNKFNLRLKAIKFDNAQYSPPKEWSPVCDDTPLEDRLPFNWDDQYRYRYKQLFQPSVFYKNASAITNFISINPEQVDAAAAIFNELFSVLIEHSVSESNLRFVVNNFDFPRYGTIIPSGWSGSIMNAFAIAGLTKGLSQFEAAPYNVAVAEFAQAFSLIHYHGKNPPSRWISYVDEHGYLWFDEYPLPDGSASRVLNGHIFSVFALALYLDWSGDQSVLPLIEGGLTTIKDNVLKFRRPGQINRYDLRNGERPDYSPERTVRQQSQLFSLTGDEFFRGMAYIFYQDIKDSGHESGKRMFSYWR